MKHRFFPAVLCCGLLLLAGCGSSGPDGNSVTFDELYEEAMQQAEDVIASESLMDDTSLRRDYGDAEEDSVPDPEDENDISRQQEEEADDTPETTAAPETTAPPQPAQTTVTAADTDAPDAAETTVSDTPQEELPQETVPVPDPDFEADAGEAAVIGYRLKNAPAAPLTVPAELGGLPVTAVAEYGFYSARYAANVVLPGTVRRMGDYAFNGSALKEFAFVPDSALTVGAHALADCRALETVRFADREYTFGDYCFEQSGIVTVTAENAVLRLADHCFQNLSKLKQVTLQGSLTTGESCFRRCPALREAAFSGGTVSLGAHTFQSSGLRDVTFTDCTGTVGAQCFADCEDLRTVKLGEGITALGDYAFADCRSLRTAELPGSLTRIADTCFADCPELTVLAPADSAAYRFAQKNGIKVKAVG